MKNLSFPVFPSFTSHAAFAALTALAALPFFTGCSEDSSTINNFSSISTLEEGSSLKDFKCSKANAGEMVFVTDSSAVYYCVDEKWITLNGKDGKDGEKGEAGADGSDGKNGADGKNGKDGKDGVSVKDTVVISKVDTLVVSRVDTVVVSKVDTVVISKIDTLVLVQSSESNATPESSSSASVLGSFTDARDNKIYKTVKIGNQTWMAENLNFEYNAGTAKSYCYESSADSCAKYGRLYRWSAAIDSAALFSNAGKGCGYMITCGSSVSGSIRGVCPEGWHLPSNGEWNILFTYVGGAASAGSALKADKGWAAGGNGSDQYGFSILPAGYFNGYDGRFYQKGDRAYFWSSTQGSYEYAYDEYFVYDSFEGVSTKSMRYQGYSVRCILNVD